MTCGIYRLIFEGTESTYIGQSLGVEGRFLRHKRKMVTGSSSKKLMEAYKLYGLPTLEILTECDPKELDGLEDEAIDIYNTVEKGFNTYDKARGSGDVHLPGELNGRSTNSNKAIEEIFKLLCMGTLSLERVSSLTNASIHVVTKIAGGTGHLWLKEKYPLEYATLMSYKGKRNRGDATTHSIHSNDKIRAIFLSCVTNPLLTQRSIADTHSVSRSTVVSICTGTKYKWLNEEYPTEYIELLNRKGTRKELKDSARLLPKVVSPSGSIHEVANISAFARLNGVDPGALGKVIRGQLKHAKSWTLLKEDNE